MGVYRVVSLILITTILLLPASFTSAEGEKQAALTLSLVGDPLKGKAPYAIDTWRIGSNHFVARGEYNGRKLGMFSFDNANGALTKTDSVPVGKGLSSLAAGGKDNAFVFSANIRRDQLAAFKVDPGSKTLSSIQKVPSGGTGPIKIDLDWVAIDDNGFCAVLNQDSAELTMFKVNEGGMLSSWVRVPTLPEPMAVKLIGNRIVIAHSQGNVVMALLDKDTGVVIPFDIDDAGGHITAMAVNGKKLAVSTAEGDVVTYRVGPDSLSFLERNSLGKGYISDLTFAGKRTLFVTGGVGDGWLAGYKYPKNGRLTLQGELALAGQSQRTLATVKGDEKGETFVIVNEFHNNRSLVVRATF